MSSAKQPKKHFDAIIYTGNGGVQNISGLQFSPDLVWVKRRDSSSSHMLFDTIRGATKGLQSEAIAAEFTDATTLTSFGSNGFTLGSHQYGNVNGGSYVTWCWNAGDTTVTNNDGTIESQVRVNQEAGFSIVKIPNYTYPTKTVGHGLNSEPAFIITKSIDASNPWIIYHKSLGPDAYLQFDNGDSYTGISGVWSGITSSVFPLSQSVNQEVDTLAYCWSEVPGFSSFGTYVGNGQDDGPMVNCGFKPRFILTKSTSGLGSNWNIHDTARDPFNPSSEVLSANLADATLNNGNTDIDIFSNGFKLKADVNGQSNYAGATYIYAAFAEKPNSRPEEIITTFEPDVYATWDRKQYNFAVGDNVYQNSTGVVNTSDITDVTDNTDGSQTLTFTDDSQFGSLSVGDTLVQSYTASATADSVVASTEDGYMNGLRFDGSRDTYLERSGTTPTPTFTISFWIKRTETNNARAFKIEGAKDDNKLLCVWAFGDGSLRINDNSATRLQVANALPANQWVHVVVNRTTTDINAYVNGAASTVANTQTFGAGTYAYNVGGYGDAGTSDLNGYMSDVYFVEGQELSPETFAFDDGGTWKALPSEIVKGLITTTDIVDPYDTRDNYDEEWSAGTVTTEGNVNADQLWGNMFNGDLSNHTSSSADQQNARATLSLSNLTWSTSVELYIKSNPAGVQQIRINDTNIGATTIHDNWQDITALLLTAGITQLESISIGDNAGGSATQLNYAAIRIDGRILVDGPADNSQNWSGSWNTTQINDPTNAFDGSDTTYAQSAINNPQDIGFAFETPFNTSVTGDDVNIVVSSTAAMTLWFGKNGEVTSINTGDGVLVNTNTTPVTVTIPSAGSDISSIEFGQKSGVGAIRIHAVRIGNTLLVDAPVKWDISQVWSGGLAGDRDGSPVEVTSPGLSFNGDISTAGSAPHVANTTTTLTWTPPGGSLSGTSYRIFTYQPQQTAGARMYLSTNGGAYVEDLDGWATVGVNNNGWSTSQTIPGGLLTSISLQFTYSNDNVLPIYAIEIDGIVLVDAANFGSNGFFLPFDPAAQGIAGQKWSDDLPAAQASTAPSAFDGDIGTRAYGPQGGPFTWNNTHGVSGSTWRMYIYVGISTTVTNTYQADSGTVYNGWTEKEDWSSGLYAWVTITDAPETPTSITITATASNGNPYLGAIEVDGRILIDYVSYSGIGTDASGNGNHFTDQNFAVGNTSHNWLSSFTCDKPQNPGQSLLDAFDGNLTTTTGEQVGSAIYTFVAPLTGNYRISMYTNGQRPIKVDGVTVVTAPTEGSVRWYDIGSVTTGQVITVDGAGQAGGGFIAAWEVDGELLIQPNIQDTVLDTPLFDYAVLDSGSNGNLVEDNVASGTSQVRSSTIVPTNKIYWETTIGKVQGTVGGFYGVNASGQRPDRSGGAAIYLGASSGSGGIWVDGTRVKSADYSATIGDIVGITFDPDTRETSFYRNGSLEDTVTAPNTTDLMPITGVNESVMATVNFGQQPFVHATDNGNGTVTLVDTSPNRAEDWYANSVFTINVPIDGTDTYNYPPAVFDDVVEQKGVWTNGGGNFTWDYASGIVVNKKIEIYTANYNSSTDFTVDLGSGPVAATLSNDSSGWGWRTIENVTGTLTQLTMTALSGSVGCTMTAVRVDGRLLVDGPADTSQVWSSTPTNVEPTVVSNAFDGDLTTQCYSSGTTDAFFSISDITATKVECYGFTPDGTFYVDGSSRQEVSCAAGWVEVYNGTSITINKLGFTRSGGSGGGHSAWRINGEILVDGVDTGPFDTLHQDNPVNTQTVTYSGGTMIEEVPVGTSFGDAGYKVSADNTTIELMAGSVSPSDTITSVEQVNSGTIVSIDPDNNQITTK